MSRPFLKLPSFDGVAAGQIATIKMPIGFRYHALFLNYSGITLAQMTEIRILLNGQPFQRFSGVERDVLNQEDGRPAAAGILVLPFDRYGLKNRAGEEETAINTGSEDSRGISIDSFHVEIDIDAGAAAPVLSMKAERTAKLEGGPGVIPYIYKFTRNLASGEVTVSDLPYGRLETQALEKLMLTTASVNSIRLDRDTFPVIDRTAAENTLILTEGVRVPQAGYMILDMTERGYAADLFPLVGLNDFAVVIDMAAAENVSVIAQYVGSISN